MNPHEISGPSSSDALLAICLFAAFADGEQSDAEREMIAKLSAETGNDGPALISRRILMGKLDLKAAVAALESQQQCLLAYEMARSVCEAGGLISADEQAFLTDLRSLLALGGGDSQRVENDVDSLAHVPLDSGEGLGLPDENGSMILKYSILNGALELLPATMATLAIITLQMKMVYRIGKSHGVDLDRSSIKELLATMGVGLGSQVVEGFARNLMRGFGEKVAGGSGSRMVSQLTGSAFSFASTYAIGHAAEMYFAGGRQLGVAEIKRLLADFTREGREMQSKYLPQIQERAKSLNAASILSLVRSGPA